MIDERSVTWHVRSCVPKLVYCLCLKPDQDEQGITQSAQFEMH
ncbi:hypothetical protein LCGC14_2508250, partial [marine sediment metagenome]